MQRIQSGNLSEKEKGYLIGLFLGDGYAIYDKKNRHYNIEFYLNSVKDTDIQDYLLQILRKSNTIAQIFKDQRCNVNRIRVSSKMFFHFLQNEIRRFKYQGTNAAKDFLFGVLSGLIDAEGWVCYGTILFSQKGDWLAHQFEQVCKRLNVRFSSRQRNNTCGGKIWRIYVSTSFKYLAHVSKKVMREYGCPLP
jgi:hypothetical protein